MQVVVSYLRFHVHTSFISLPRDVCSDLRPLATMWYAHGSFLGGGFVAENLFHFCYTRTGRSDLTVQALVNFSGLGVIAAILEMLRVHRGAANTSKRVQNQSIIII